MLIKTIQQNFLRNIFRNSPNKFHRKKFSIRLFLIFIFLASLSTLLIANTTNNAFLGVSFKPAKPKLSIFPLENYDQNIDHWIKPTNSTYQKPLINLEYQKKRLKEFYQHTFSSDADGQSPWSENYVNKQFTLTPNVYTYQQELLTKFNNENKDAEHTGQGVNFRPYPKDWIENIAKNINIEQFKNELKYKPQNRAILVQNTHARALPTLEPYFFHHTLPGEGYPFDQLQMSSLWAGSPVYIVGETKDKNWSLVLTSDFIGWIPSESLAKTDERFVSLWQFTAKNKMTAIIQTEAPIFDSENKNHLFKSYVGSVYPMVAERDGQFQILIPIKNPSGSAQIRKATVNKNHAVEMPWVATPENFVKLIKTLQNRPYGWGGLHFLNDCSAELKSIYTPFGFWLPRHSSSQITTGKMIDKSDPTLSPKEKIEYLKQNGRPFMTFIYNTKHVFMYLGSFNNTNAKDNVIVPMTYQNLWGLKPKDASRRAIVGKAVLLPLLETFPEDGELNSHANHKDFKIIHLDEWP